MHAIAAQLPRTPAPPREAADGCVIAQFFALDTDGRIAWPFRYVLRDGGVQPQRWRFGQWVYSPQLLAFMRGEDDRFVDASIQEVDSWIQRHSWAWHSMARSNAVAAE